MNIQIPYRNLKTAILICLCYLILTTFYYHIDKNLTGILFITLKLLIVLLFISIFVFLAKEVKVITVNRRQLTLKLCLPAIVLGITLLYTCFSPYKLTSEALESKPVLRACFEGTQNQAYIVFREDKTFEMNWSGTFFYDEWFIGNYVEHNDTLILQYKKNKPSRFGALLLKSGESLVSLDNPIDTTKHYVPFYLGYCRLLN